jgi:signal transduction histidine kinase
MSTGGENRRAELASWLTATPVFVLLAIGFAATLGLIAALRLQWAAPFDIAFAALSLAALTALGVAFWRQSRQVAEQQRRLAERLERERELGGLKSRFVSMVSHEIRTPLTTIYAASDILKHYGAKMSPAEHLQEIEAIQAEVRAIPGLVEDVLTVDENEERTPRLRYEAVDLESFAREIWNRCRLLLQAKHELEIAGIEPGVGPGADWGPAVVEVTRLRQILDNLFTNAIKYSPGAQSVRLELSRANARLTLRVIDSGIGIPAADRARVFEAFHRGANVEAISGSGLGLAVVQKATGQLGGTLSIDSEIGKGTTVEVRLPAREAPSAEGAQV